MLSADEPTARTRRGWAEKREAITRAALTVFGREGYTRASIDAIASEASVSTRTIYNHFTNKEQLFLTVIQDSSTHVADAQIALIDRHFDTITAHLDTDNLERGLVDFGCVWATSTADFGEHFALVRQINAEVGHIPQPTLDRWQEIGPQRVHRQLARRLQHLADKGLLHITDAGQAAHHLVLLTAGEITSRSHYGANPLDENDVTRIATAGVQTFLHGYQQPAVPAPAATP